MSERVSDTTMLVPVARSTRRTWAGGILAGILLILSPVLVVGAFLVGFHSQDEAFLQSNPLVMQEDLRAGIRQAFRLPDAETKLSGGGYAPLTQLTVGLQYRLLRAPAWPFRVVNLLLHIATAWFLYRIILALLPRGAPLSAAEEPVNADAQFNTGRCVVAVFGALFFFLHPINVEAVVWVSQRGCIQAVFFGVLAWWLITRQGPNRRNWRCLATPSWGCYGLSLLCLILASLSHSLGCAFFGVLALTECIWIHESAFNRWVRAVGFIAVGAAFLVPSVTSGLWRPEGGSALPLNLLLLLGRSLLNILVPTTLSATYAFPPPGGPDQMVGICIAAVLLLALIAVPAWLPIGTRPAFVLLPGFMLVLLPWLFPGAVLDVPGHEGLHLAFPLVGVMFGLGAEAIQYRLRFMGREGGKIGETVGFGLAVVLFVLLSLLSLARSFDFKDDVTLFRHAVSRQPLSYVANLRLAEELSGQARAMGVTPETAQAYWKEAQDHIAVLSFAVDRDRFGQLARQYLLEGEIAFRLGKTGGEEKIRIARESLKDNDPLSVRADELLTEIEERRGSENRTDPTEHGVPGVQLPLDP